jgi:hypothetical protein
MSFARTRYDDCAYKRQIAESTGPGDYAIGTPFPDCAGNDPCSVHAAPGVALERRPVAVPASMRPAVAAQTNIGSQLMGLGRPLDRWAETCKPIQPLENPYAPTECGGCAFSDLSPEPTLLSNPKCTNKETTINRWSWLHSDPQVGADRPFQSMVSTRILAKDNHRPCVRERVPNTTNAVVSKAVSDDQWAKAQACVQSGRPLPHPTYPNLLSARNQGVLVVGDERPRPHRQLNQNH